MFPGFQEQYYEEKLSEIGLQGFQYRHDKRMTTQS